MMHYARDLSSANPGPASAAREQQFQPFATDSADERPAGSTATHAHRIALLASISAGTLARLNESIRLEITSTNGSRGCRRLAAGSVECSCKYCAYFWSRLEEMLTAHLGTRRARGTNR